MLVFLFAPLHESVHRTAFRSRRLNDAVAWIAGLVLLLPPNWFRAFHFAHHRHTQIEGRDPELEMKRVETWPDYLVHLSRLALLEGRRAAAPPKRLRPRGRAFVPPRLEPRLVREARIMLAVYALVAALSVAFRSDAALLYWVLPVLLGQPFLRAYLLAEHTGLPLVEDFWENTRTTLTGAPVRFLAWNMPFHAEHHVNPAVPFHALPELHRARTGEAQGGLARLCRLSSRMAGAAPLRALQRLRSASVNQPTPAMHQRRAARVDPA